MASAANAQIRPDLDPRRTTNLVPHILDYLAAVDPDGLFAEYPISAVSYQEGYRSITYSAFANAVNGLAHWIRETLGKPSREYEVLAYIGPNDLRYPALVLDAVKAGYTLFLTSLRNSVPAQITMFQGLSCQTLLSSSPRPPQVQAIADAHPEVKIVEVPAVEDLLEKKFEHFVYDKTYLEELEKPMFVAHTSGSTGFPKPLVYKHGTAITNTRLMALESPEGFHSVQRQFERKRMFMTFPPFHAAYFVMSLFNCLPLGTVFLSPIAGAIPSAEELVEGLK
ncbi:hypothetical protein VTN77DRAFT_459 [Rasamsonia byssochlamydoides]|uniref:uncharacterized protein n=1 Tax=Rasamsonia byssochlamydoides TaxID=89139 RepID=UPI00374250D2